MPYVKQEARDRLHHLIEAFYATPLKDAGELNYIITSLVQTYVAGHGVSYQRFNDVMGALEGAKLELYRRGIAPYEDRKANENGDVLETMLRIAIDPQCDLPDSGESE